MTEPKPGSFVAIAILSARAWANRDLTGRQSQPVIRHRASQSETIFHHVEPIHRVLW